MVVGRQILVTTLVASACLSWMASCVGDDPGEPGSNPDASTPDTASAIEGGASDAGLSSDVVVEADAEAACNPEGAFQPAVEVPGLHAAGGNEWGFRLSADGNTAVVTRNFDAKPGHFILYLATRQTGGGFDTGTPIGSDINLPEGGVADRGTFADGDLTLYYDAIRDGGFELFGATRGSTSADFKSPFGLGPNVNSPEADGQPMFVGTHLYFVRYAPGGVSPKVMRALRGGSTFSVTPETLVNLDDFAFPVVLPNELSMYVGKGGDIYFTSRATTSGAFGLPVKVVAPVSTSDHEEPLDVTPDGCTLYIGRGTAFTRRVYALTRSK
jgi:hypothetical protein